MKTKSLTAAQIDTLAQRLSETPIEPATSAKKAGDNLARLLTARTGAERAALAFTSIMTAETCDQAEARLTLVLDYGNPDPSGEPIPAPVDQPKLTDAERNQVTTRLQDLIGLSSTDRASLAKLEYPGVYAIALRILHP